MKVDINEKNKIVSLWFASSESPQDNLPMNWKKEIEEYRKKKYRICMYQSGNDDINKNLLSLVLNNAHYNI